MLEQSFVDELKFEILRAFAKVVREAVTKTFQKRDIPFEELSFRSLDDYWVLVSYKEKPVLKWREPRVVVNEIDHTVQYQFDVMEVKDG